MKPCDGSVAEAERRIRKDAFRVLAAGPTAFAETVLVELVMKMTVTIEMTIDSAKRHRIVQVW